MMLPDSDPARIAAHLAWIKPHFFDETTGDIGSRIQTWVVRTPKHTILVDTGVGNDKQRADNPAWHLRQGTFLDDLKAQGITPEQVDYVLCTHMHIDHVGWNTRLVDGRWCRRFPTRPTFAGEEWEFWKHESETGKDPYGCIDDSVLPIVSAGQALLVDSDHAVDEYLRFEPWRATPARWHPPDHAAGEAVFGDQDLPGRHRREPGAPRRPGLDPRRPLSPPRPHRPGGGRLPLRARLMPSFPGYRLPEELVALREQVRRFVRDEIIPLEQRLDPDAPEIPDEDYARLSAKTKAAGLWCLGVPEKYGGGGLDTFSMSVLLEEMSQHRMGLYNPGCGVFGRPPAPFIFGGNREQIERYALPAIREGHLTFFAIRSRATARIAAPSGHRGQAQEHWVLNGTRSSSPASGVGRVFARTDRTSRAGISAFIIEGHPRLHARPIRTIRTAAVPCEVALEDCKVPLENWWAEGSGLNLALGTIASVSVLRLQPGVAVAAHHGGRP
jgi:hypothetical protein